MASRRPASTYTPPSADDSYWLVSKRPLQVLVFLLPLIIVYEIGLASLLRIEDSTTTNVAHKYLLIFFETFGVAANGGQYLGGLLIVVVLLAWHVLNKDPWRIDPPALGFMAIESVLWTLPLLVIGLLVQRAFLGNPSGFGDLGIGSKLTISVGAGLYEELVYRMLVIAIVHTLLVDALRASERVGTTIAIVISAAAFMWYHPLGGDQAASRMIFYFLAGLFFGVIYTLRGFGIAVAAHALYDVIVSLLA